MKKDNTNTEFKSIADAYSKLMRPVPFLNSMNDDSLPSDVLKGVDTKTIKKWMVNAGIKPRFLESRRSMARRFVNGFTRPGDRIFMNIDRRESAFQTVDVGGYPEFTGGNKQMFAPQIDGLMLNGKPMEVGKQYALTDGDYILGGEIES